MAVGCELGDEGIRIAGEFQVGSGEAGTAGTDHVQPALRIEGNAADVVRAVGADVRGVGDDGVNSEGKRAIIAAERQADGVAGMEGEGRGHVVLVAIDLLERTGLAPGEPEAELNLAAVDGDGAGEVEDHLFRMAARGGKNIVFERVVASVKNNINAGIDRAVTDFGKYRYAGAPILG